MKIRVSDPLALLPYQTGILRPPLEKKKAEGNAASALDTNQRAIELGEPVPIVFGKYTILVVGGIQQQWGGVFISPGATKARYQDVVNTDVNPTGTANVLQVDMCFVLSQGQLGQVYGQDVYQRACRKGTAWIFYNALAGPYIAPGNDIDYTDLWVCPNYCGTDDGTYEDMTTLRYQNFYAPGDDTWNRQVHVFIRNGIKVPRLIEGTTDSSNNMVDLALYLIRKTSRVPELLIDTAAMLLAANFTATNGFNWDGVIKESANLEDWMQQMASYFLLRVSDNNGKKGFRSRLPLNANYTINTGTISWVFGFTEEHILPDDFQIEYIPLSERKPICAQMIWRQQPPNDIGFIRTTEVRIDGEAVDGPYEQFDMSQFCTRENHAVKVGAYEVARRKYVTHSLRIRVKPDSYNTTLTLGDIVRVQLRRENDPGVVSFHDYLYEVEKINKTQSGVVELDLMHFPIDALGRSILALYVTGAEGTGYVYDIGRNDYSCDDPDNAGDDTPLPDDVGENNPDTPDTDVDLPQPGTDVNNPPNDAPVFTPGSEIGGGPGGTTGVAPSGSPTGNNPADPFDTDTPGGGGTIGGIPTDRPLLPGDEITYTPPCCPAEVLLYAVDPDTGIKLQEAPVAIGTAIVGDCEVRFEILAEYIFDTATAFYFTHRCVDPGSPDGYGSELPGGTTPGTGPLQANGAGEYRITLPDWSTGFVLTEENYWYSIYVDKAICGGDNWKRALAWVEQSTGDLVTGTWGPCTSSIFLEPGQVYGNLYRRIPGTTGSGMDNFEFIRTLYVL